MKSLSLRANFSWVFASNIVYGAYQWVLVALVAKHSGPQEVGQFALALAIVTPVQMLFNLQLRALQASDASGEYSFNHYVSLRTYTVIICAVVVVCLSLMIPMPATSRYVVWAVLAIKSIESLSDVVYGAFQLAERMDVSSRARLFESTLASTAFSFTLWTTGSLTVSLIAISFALVIVILVYTVPQLSLSLQLQSNVLVPSTDWDRLLTLLASALPLGLTMGIMSLNSSLPRLALGYFSTTSEVGVFSAFMQLVVAGTMLVGALGQAVTPTLARLNLQNDRTRFIKLLNKLVGVGFGIGAVATLGAAAAGKEVVAFLYTPEFSGYHLALIILAASSTFSFAASFQGYAATAARVIRPQVWIFLAVTFTTGVSLVILVPSYGIEGAAFAVLAGSFAQYILSGSVLRWKMKRQ